MTGSAPSSSRRSIVLWKFGLPAAAVGDVRRGDEELADDVVILGEELVVNVHQLALADRGGRLLARHILGALGQVKLAEAHGNGAGGNENDLVARVLQVAEAFCTAAPSAEDSAVLWGSERGRCPP